MPFGVIVPNASIEKRRQSKRSERDEMKGEMEGEMGEMEG